MRPLGTALGKNMSKPQKIILIVGLVWCAICALFPPRQYNGGASDARIIPTHEFLFSPRFQMFHYQEHLGNYYSVEVNGGRLLAELALIVVITGIVFLLQEECAKCFREAIRDAQPGAAPNGGPAASSGKPAGPGGPPSVS